MDSIDLRLRQATRAVARAIAGADALEPLATEVGAALRTAGLASLVAVRDTVTGIVHRSGEDPLAPEDAALLTATKPVLEPHRVALPLIAAESAVGVLLVIGPARARSQGSPDSPPSALGLDPVIAFMTDLAADLGLAWHRLARAEARESAARAEGAARALALLDQAGDALIIHDFEGRIVELNRRACEMLAYSRDELLGLTTRDIVPAMHPLATRQTLDRLHAGDRLTRNIDLRRKDGTIFPTEVSLGVFEPNAPARLFVALARDISERRRTEALLAESRERLAALIEWVDDLVFTLDADGRFVDYHAASSRLYVEPSEFIGRRPEEVLPPDVAHALLRALDEVRETGLPVSLDYRLDVASASWWNARLTARRDARGAFAGVAVVSRNITAQKAYEQALRESEQRLSTIFRVVLAGVVITRRSDGRIVDVNETFLAQLGLSRDEIRDKTTIDLGLYVDPRDRERGLTELDAFGSVRSLPARIRRQSGEVGDFLLSAGLAELGGHECVIAIWHDITELRQADRALRANAQELAAMFDLAPVGIGLLDARTLCWQRVNSRLRAISGYDEAELGQRTLADLAHPDDRAGLRDALVRVVMGLLPEARSEGRLLRKTGETAWVSLHVTVLRDATGQPAELLVTLEDITQRRAAEATMRLQATALEVTANGIVITDPLGRIQWVNPAFLALTGHSAADVIGRTTRDVDGGFHAPALFDELRTTLARGASWTGEMVCRRKDGTLYDQATTVTPVRDADGAITHLVAIKQDITERRRAAAALAEASARYRHALDAGELGTLRHDLATDTISLDARAQQHWGVSQSTMSFGALLERVHADDRIRIRDAVGAALAHGGPSRLAFEHRVAPSDEHRQDGRSEGEVRWISAHIQLHWEGGASDGPPTFGVATTQDVTATRRAELALRLSEERYRTLVDSLDDIIFSTDLEGRITFISRAVEALGYQPEALIGRSRDELVHPEDAPGLRQRAAEASVLENQGSFEYRVLDARGQVHFVRSSSRPLRQGDRVVGRTGVISDRTVQKAVEDQLREAQKLDAIGKLAGGVAHDFNNLLSVIISYNDLAMASLVPDDPLRADLEEVRRAAERAEVLTRQLLAFSRRQVLRPEPVALDELVRAVATMLRRLLGEASELRLVSQAELWRVKADRSQIEQVLVNLLVNARDAMPDGGTVTLATANVTLTATGATGLGLPAGDYVELVVSDTGVGMDEPTRARVFEPFFTTREPGRGGGLGLATVYGIVTQSGGAIGVETKPGHGSAFRILLPRLAEADERRVARQAAPTVAAGSDEHILVVEDETALRNLVRRILESAGYRVHAAPNGAEALMYAEAHGDDIDLVVTDVVMPGMNGRQLAERLHLLRPELRILYMSGYAEEAIERHDVLGPNFLPKPFDAHTLTRKVRSVLDG